MTVSQEEFDSIKHRLFMAESALKFSKWVTCWFLDHHQRKLKFNPRALEMKYAGRYFVKDTIDPVNGDISMELINVEDLRVDRA